VSRRLIGTRARRSHDQKLLTGQGAYIDDVHLPGLLHMAVWRSPVAHAYVRAIDFARAAAVTDFCQALLTANEFLYVD